MAPSLMRIVTASRLSTTEAPVSFEISSGVGNRSPLRKCPVRTASLAKATSSEEECLFRDSTC